MLLSLFSKKLQKLDLQKILKQKIDCKYDFFYSRFYEKLSQNIWANKKLGFTKHISQKIPTMMSKTSCEDA